MNLMFYHTLAASFLSLMSDQMVMEMKIRKQIMRVRKMVMLSWKEAPA